MKLTEIKYKVEILMGLIILVLLIFFCIQCERSKNANSKIKIFTQNEQALKKELKTNLNKDKEIYTQSAIFISENDKLHEVNKDLSTEIKKYNDKVLYLTKVISTYKKKIILDSNKTTVSTSPVIDTTVIYSDSVAKIGCKVMVFELEKELKVICSIEYYELEMPIYLGIMENKQGVVSTFVRSDIDKINFNIFSTMKPAMFTNVERPRYGIGFYAGGGLQSNFTSDVKLGLSVGLCFYYSLFNF